ncbi:MAG: hypothetical protein HCA25_00430 (plasmid) [Dolichospermum sp. DET50]|jgi:hypothetical protein|nr:hypothetical protein [Dolichospermum sp. DET66]MBS3035972.1 hypothetical protein [Dolichospermum sp. DET67]MBS3041140.1 hypothetical protein [Dolichospermum sp. DET50]QSX70882.1 MAG: hypothetical protein EZY12_27155 [Dolichospermum sp. DET69]
MSRESLGLYCLHIFIIKTAVSLSQKFIGRIDGTNICFASLVDVLVILAICYPLSHLWNEIQKAISNQGKRI